MNKLFTVLLIVSLSFLAKGEETLLNENFNDVSPVLRPLGGNDTFRDSEEWFFLFSDEGVFSSGSSGMRLRQNPLTPSALGIEIKNGLVYDRLFVVKDGFYHNYEFLIAVRTYNATLYPVAWENGIENAEADPRLIRWSVFLNDPVSQFSLALYLTNEKLWLVYDKADIGNPVTGSLVNYLIPIAQWNPNVGNATGLENNYRKINLLFDSDGRVIVNLDNVEVYRGNIPQDRDLFTRYNAVDNGVPIHALNESMTLHQYHIVMTIETEPNLYLPGNKVNNTECNAKALRRAISFLVGNFPCKNPCPLINGTLEPASYWDPTPVYSDEYGQGAEIGIKYINIKQKKGDLF